ncbi:glycosyltransferase family 9 protein [Fundidesulfovibrio agrisoli]|uniref:glycosyltransferase family 9 protein n=1 Tax=Fundidesulfovibrio agrisoli TaxID=2922717 RepID=UPI001FADC9C5|nr:glycosyltransferase family 9 protein [Fundidesulfovibrio agrisoli]
MRTLVINLTRFGDLLQTQPVIAGFKQAGDVTGVMCLQNFRQATGLLRHVDAVYDVPGASLLAALDQDWPQALGGCLAWMDAVRRDFAPQRVVNLTPSLPSRLIARAMNADEILGFGLDELGFGTYSTPWAAFLEASALHRGSSPFNVVDLFRRAAHLESAGGRFELAAPDPADAAHVAGLIAAQAGVEHAGLLGLQLGASAPKRQWPAASFAEVASAVWREHRLLPVLLGSKEDKPLAEAFAAATDVPHASLVGQTSLPQLAAAVSGLRLLLSNDTGTLHLAAGLGVPVLGIFLSTAQPIDTGPYRPGSCSLEPDMACHPCSFSHECAQSWACHGEVTPAAVLHFLGAYLRGGAWPEARGLGVRAWETVLDEHGYLDLRSLSGHGEGERAAWNRVQRTFWRQFLDAAPVEPAPGEAGCLPESLKASLRPVLEQAGGLLAVLIQQARVLGAVPRPAMRTKFMATWQRLETVFASHPLLLPLSHLWLRLSQEGATGLGHIQDFAARTASLVAALSAVVSPRS